MQPLGQNALQDSFPVMAFFSYFCVVRTRLHGAGLPGSQLPARSQWHALTQAVASGDGPGRTAGADARARAAAGVLPAHAVHARGRERAERADLQRRLAQHPAPGVPPRGPARAAAAARQRHAGPARLVHPVLAPPLVAPRRAWQRGESFWGLALVAGAAEAPVKLQWRWQRARHLAPCIVLQTALKPFKLFTGALVYVARGSLLAERPACIEGAGRAPGLQALCSVYLPQCMHCTQLHARGEQDSDMSEAGAEMRHVVCEQTLGPCCWARARAASICSLLVSSALWGFPGIAHWL